MQTTICTAGGTVASLLSATLGMISISNLLEVAVAAVVGAAFSFLTTQLLKKLFK